MLFEKPLSSASQHVAQQDITEEDVGYYDAGMRAAQGRCGDANCALIVNPMHHRTVEQSLGSDNKKLLVAGASLLVTRAVLLITRSYWLDNRKTAVSDGQEMFFMD